MLMSIIDLPQYHMYWALETRYPHRRYHVEQPIRATAFKFAYWRQFQTKRSREYGKQTLYDTASVRENCAEIEPEVEQSIDLQIIPARTSYSGIRRYNPKSQ